MNALLDFFFTPAYAQTATAASEGGGNFSLIVMCAGLLLFMYFGMWRPQSKRAKEQQNLLDSLSKGDEVVSVGGMLGRIEKVEGQYITLAIAQNVNIILQKSSVMSVMPKGTIKSIDQDKS